MRLLIVDDDDIFREELGGLLAEDGHVVSSAPSMPKAVNLLDAEEFDVVFTDLKMPRHSGLELLREVRKRWPRTLVIMITGFATVETAVEAMKAGAFDYIRKPFEVDDVREVLRLAAEELRFHQGPEPIPDPTRLARKWASRDGLDVLVLTDRELSPQPHLTVVRPKSDGSLGIREEVEAFRAHHERFALVLEGVDRLLATHRREEVVGLVEALRALMEGRGPFAVVFDPDRTSTDDVLALRAAVVAPSAHATLEALGNPIRRNVLRRVAHGPSSFMDAMHAAGIHDSPKFSFHLRKLIDEGLLVHVGDEYRITPKGLETVGVLNQLDVVVSTDELGNRVLPFRAPA